MIASIRAELRKMLTVRTTYIFLLIIVLALGLFAFYGEGYKASPELLKNPLWLTGEAINAIVATTGLMSLVGLLLITHEYRYNTIMYTLTATNSRFRILLAKVIAVSLFTIPVALVAGTLAPLLAYAGAHLHGLTAVSQYIPYGELLWRIGFTGWAFGMLALLLGTLIRHQVGALAAFFLIPGPGEGLLSLLLKNNATYLPFTALGQVANTLVAPAQGGSLDGPRAALVVGIYLVIGWIVAFVLFVRRDAN